MPKSKQSKYKAPSDDPYSSTKSGDNENTVEAVVEVEFLLHCNKCTKEVECLIQCEKCQVWFCTGCGKIGENIMSLLDECASLHWFCECCNTAAINAIRSFSNSPESPLKVLQSSVSDAINQINNLVADAKEQLKKTFSEAVRQSEETSSTDVSEVASIMNHASGS